MIEVQQRHVELTDGAQRACQLANRFPERLASAAASDERQRLANAARRHARLVDRLHITLAGPRKRPAQCSKTLTND